MQWYPEECGRSPSPPPSTNDIPHTNNEVDCQQPSNPLEQQQHPILTKKGSHEEHSEGIGLTEGVSADPPPTPFMIMEECPSCSPCCPQEEGLSVQLECEQGTEEGRKLAVVRGCTDTLRGEQEQGVCEEHEQGRIQAPPIQLHQVIPSKDMIEDKREVVYHQQSVVWYELRVMQKMKKEVPLLTKLNPPLQIEIRGPSPSSLNGSYWVVEVECTEHKVCNMLDYDYISARHVDNDISIYRPNGNSLPLPMNFKHPLGRDQGLNSLIVY